MVTLHYPTIWGYGHNAVINTHGEDAA